MKVLVFTPIWKRPEITEVYCLGLSRLRKRFDIDVFWVLSPEDPSLSRHKYLADLYDIKYCLHRNKLGEKKNAGLKEAFKLEWDYLMELNSDDIMKTELMYEYLDLMHQRVPFIGLGNFAFYNAKNGKAKHYDDKTVFGIGRLYRRDSIEGLTLWNDNADTGMDNHSERVLKDNGIYPYIVKTKEPQAFDIKYEVNIWKYDDMPGQAYDSDKLFNRLTHGEKARLSALREDY